MFNNATKFQEEKKGQQYVSVVVLDEVGLAEDSPSLPLKTLHPLLEDGTTKSQDVSLSCVIGNFQAKVHSVTDACSYNTKGL